MKICVVVEGDDHGIREGSREVLTVAGGIAGGVLATAVLLTPHNENITSEVMEFGPQTIVLPQIWPEHALPYEVVDFLSAIIEREQPDLILASESLFGRELLTHTALRYELPIFPDCIGISREQDHLVFERLWFGERISAFLSTGNQRPVLVTWREGLVNIKKRPGDHSEVIKLPFNRPRENLLRLLEEVKADPHTVDLNEAEVIVSGGGGMGSLEGFKLIHELADLIGAAVGGSRVARDNGWIPLSRQIGQTGKIVAPKLIISCGISGATQHTFGMRDAKTIIAINKDKNAPILKIADAGIVGDVHEILPDLIKRIKGGRENVGSAEA